MIKQCLVLLLSIICFISEAAETPLRVVSYNIRREGKEKAPERLWQNRKDQLMHLLESLKADIIGMQEATKTQITDIVAALNNFAAIGQGRGSSWAGLGTDEHNPILYNKNTFELLDSGTFRINTIQNSKWPFWTPLHYQQTGWLPRICTWVQLKDIKTNKIFYVYNAHLDNDYDQARNLSAQVIREHMADKHPIIFMGDFNMEFVNHLQNTFSNFDHAQDIAAQVAGPQDADGAIKTRTGWNNEELKQIDHILIQKGTANVVRYEVIAEQKPYSSDHRPVVADIVLK